MRRPRGRLGSTTTGSAGSTSASGSTAIAGTAATGARRGDATCAARCRRSLARRAVTSRATATYEAWVTSSTPTGTVASSSSQVPTWPSVLEKPLVSAQPTQPPAARIPPRVTFWATNVSEACCSRPAAASTSTAMPASGTQPRAPRGCTNAESPQARHQDRQQEPRVAEGAEQRPTQPGSDRTDARPLLGGAQARIEDRQRDGREPRDGHREDAARLAEPSAMVARAACAARPRRRGPGGYRLVGLGRNGRGHQTSRIIGSTNGLRWKRWFTNWRTAVRTRALVASRSHGSSDPRSASAASTAARISSTRVSLSLT